MLNRVNGVDSNNDESAVRRRMKQEALREKIREIKAHQKESEAMKGIYRSFPTKYLIMVLMFGIGASVYYYKSS